MAFWMLWGVVCAIGFERGLMLPVCFFATVVVTVVIEKINMLQLNQMIFYVVVVFVAVVSVVKYSENVVLVHHLYVVIEQCMVLVFLLQRYYYYQHLQCFYKVLIHVQVQI